MLNTTFPRLMGDIGRQETFDFPVEYYYVDGANSKSVVLSRNDLSDSFLMGALELQSRGCDFISTSCGFLLTYQNKIAKKLTVPFVSSSLIFLEFLQTLYGDKRKIGVLTANKNMLLERLKTNHEINIDEDCLEGMEGTYFHQVYVDNKVHSYEELDDDLLYKDIKECALKLLTKNKSINVILFECTNMSPFRKRLSLDIHLPIYDIISMLNYIYKINNG